MSLRDEIQRALTDEDLKSPAWKRIRDIYIKARIAEMRVDNDSLRHNAEETAALRGGLRELKNLVDAVERRILTPEVKPVPGEHYD